MQTFAAIMTLITMLPFAAAAAEPCVRKPDGVLCTADGFDKLIAKYRDRDADAKTCNLALEARKADLETVDNALRACHAVLPEVKPMPTHEPALIGVSLGTIGGALIASGVLTQGHTAYLVGTGAVSLMIGIFAAMWE